MGKDQKGEKEEEEEIRECQSCEVGILDAHISCTHLKFEKTINKTKRAKGSVID